VQAYSHLTLVLFYVKLSTMSRQNRGKLNRLLLSWPKGVICTSKWMKNQGFSRQLLDRYKKSNWLMPVGTGAYKLANDTVNWTGALYAIQNQLELNCHPGGKTALQLKGLAHFVPGELKEIFIFGPPGEKLPSWFKAYDWEVEIHYSMTNLFNNDLGLSKEDYGTFSISISAAERAIMEMLYLVPQKQTLSESSLIMENLVSLRPKTVQALLENCKSIKVKRLFMLLAEKHEHQWVKKLDISKFNLGTGKIALTRGGVYNKKYKIVIPNISG
jgi:hypothetical protein